MQPEFINEMSEAKLLGNAGLVSNDVNSWIGALPTLRSNFADDAVACSAFWDLSKRLRGQLSKKAVRKPNETAASELIHDRDRKLREHFLNIHVQELYNKLTNSGANFL